jgi:hypothetical protein
LEICIEKSVVSNREALKLSARPSNILKIGNPVPLDTYVEKFV